MKFIATSCHWNTCLKSLYHIDYDFNQFPLQKISLLWPKDIREDIDWMIKMKGKNRKCSNDLLILTINPPTIGHEFLVITPGERASKLWASFVTWVALKQHFLWQTLWYMFLTWVANQTYFQEKTKCIVTRAAFIESILLKRTGKKVWGAFTICLEIFANLCFVAWFVPAARTRSFERCLHKTKSTREQFGWSQHFI